MSGAGGDEQPQSQQHASLLLEEATADASLLMPLPVPAPSTRVADPVAAAMQIGLSSPSPQLPRHGSGGSGGSSSVACPLSPPSLSLAFSNHPPTSSSAAGATASAEGGAFGSGGYGDGFVLSERAMSEFGDPDYQMFLQSLVNDGDDFLFADEEDDDDADPTYDPRQERAAAAGRDGGRGSDDDEEGEGDVSDSERSSASSSSTSGSSSRGSSSDGEGSSGSGSSSDEDEEEEDDYETVRLIYFLSQMNPTPVTHPPLTTYTPQPTLRSPSRKSRSYCGTRASDPTSPPRSRSSPQRAAAPPPRRAACPWWRPRAGGGSWCRCSRTTRARALGSRRGRGRWVGGYVCVHLRDGRAG